MKYIEDLYVLPEPQKTFMEVLKVHNKEVPIANLLAYFFRNKESHNWKNTFLQALLLTPYTELNKDIKETRSPNLSLLHDVFVSNESEQLKVKTEEPTENDKRIDLLIIAKEFVVCIEFKINHNLDNPLSNYKKFITDNYPNKKHIFIILTPFAKEAIGDAKVFIQENSDFKQIILGKFIKTVKELLPENYFEKEISDTYYLKELIQTIENREIRFKRSYVLKEFQNKYKYFEFHNNNRGGFLEYKTAHLWYKIRISNKEWLIENWKNNEKITSKLNLFTNFEEIIRLIK